MIKYKVLRKVTISAILLISASASIYGVHKLQEEANKAKEELSAAKDLVEDLREQADEDRATLKWVESEHAKAIQYNKELANLYTASKKTTAGLNTKLKNMKKTNVVLEGDIKTLREELNAKK